MDRWKFALICVAVAFALAAGGRSASAQTLLGGNFADENLTSDVLRTPGTMVTSGLARAQAATERGRARPNITATEDTTPRPRQQFVSEALTLLFNQLRALIAFFGNRLAVRAGLPEVFEPDGTAITNSTGGALGGVLDDIGSGTPNEPADDTATDTRTPTRTGGRTSRKQPLPQ